MRVLILLIALLVPVSGWAATYYMTNFSGTYRYSQDVWPTVVSAACSSNSITGCLTSIGANNTLVVDGGPSGIAYSGGGNNPTMPFDGQTLRGPVVTDPDILNHGGVVTLNGVNSTQINVNNKNNITISDLTLTNYTAQGIFLSNSGTALGNLSISRVIGNSSAQLVYVAVSGTGTLSRLTLSNLIVSGTATYGTRVVGGGKITDAVVSNISINATGMTTAAIDIGGITNLDADNITITGTSGVNSGILLQTLTGVWSLDTFSVVGASDTQAVYINACSGTGSISNGNLSAGSTPGNGVFIYNSSATDIDVIDVVANGYGTGFDVTGTTSNVNYLRCTAKNSPSGDGFRLNGTITGASYTDCLAEYNYNDGFSTYLASNATYTRCVSRYNGTTGVANSGDGFTGHGTATHIIQNCKSHNNKNSGYAFTATTGGSISNSVAVDNGSSGFPRGGLYFELDSTAGPGWTVKNYIGESNYPYEISMNYFGFSDSVLDNNCYYHVGSGITENSFASIDMTNDSVNNRTTESWATYSATQENNSKYGDPRLTSDYRLSPGSPCIQAGTPISGLTTDFAGKAWKNPPSIGAYEYYRKGGSGWGQYNFGFGW